MSPRDWLIHAEALCMDELSHRGLCEELHPEDELTSGMCNAV